MKYRGLLIDKEYTDIYRKNTETGKIYSRGGYVCRVYTDGDIYRNKCLYQFKLVNGEDYAWNEDDSEINKIITLIDEFYEDIMKEAQKPMPERTYTCLQNVVNWLVTAFNRADLKDIIETELELTKDEFNHFVGYDYFD